MKPRRKPVYEAEGELGGYEIFSMGYSCGIAVKCGKKYRLSAWADTLKQAEAMLVAAQEAKAKAGKEKK